jgi:probable HAF family extracellular repeat protein
MPLIRHTRTLAALSIAALATAAIAQPVYTIHDLGTLSIYGSTGTGINTSGIVCGLSNLSQNPGEIHSFRWLNGGMIDIGVLGTLPPPGQYPRPETFALAINDSGQIAGKADIPGGPGYLGFLWLPEPAYGLPTGMNQVPGFQYAGQTEIYALNNSGQLVGEARPIGGDGPAPVRWERTNNQWTLTNLGVLVGPYGRAQGINNLGQIVGHSNSIGPGGNSVFHAFLWLPAPAYGLPAGISDLSPPATQNDDGNTFAWGINDLGQAAGRGYNWTPAVWLPSPAYGLPAGWTSWPNATVFDQATIDRHGWLYLETCELTAINTQGVAIGSATFVAFSPFPPPNGRYYRVTRAFIWSGGHFTLLDDDLAPGSDWTQINAANAINSNGLITGIGTRTDGSTDAFILTPPLPLCPADFNRDGAVNVADFLAFLQAYAAADLRCDFNGDGVVSVQDFLAYLQLYPAGC